MTFHPYRKNLHRRITRAIQALVIELRVHAIVVCQIQIQTKEIQAKEKVVIVARYHW